MSSNLSKDGVLSKEFLSNPSGRVVSTSFGDFIYEDGEPIQMRNGDSVQVCGLEKSSDSLLMRRILSQKRDRMGD